MSYLVSTFAGQGLLAPQTLDRFAVSIPGFLAAPVRVSATSLPNKVRSEITINVSGQPVYLPSKSQVPGEWAVSVRETRLAESNLTIQNLLDLVSDSADGRVSGFKLFDADVFVLGTTIPNPLYWNTLKGCWLKSIEPIQLDWARPGEPLVWRLMFRYSNIVRVNGANIATAISNLVNSIL